MNSVLLLKDNYSPKEEMSKFLNNDDKYWLKNNIWDMKKMFSLDTQKVARKRYLNFECITSSKIRLEIKYSVVYGLKNKYFKVTDFMRNFSPSLNKLNKYFKFNNIKSFADLNVYHYKLFLLNSEKHTQVTSEKYTKYFSILIDIINNIYDNQEETEKDIWDCFKINGARIPANCKKTSPINFLKYPKYYRECIKRYFRHIITKKSISRCTDIYRALLEFFNIFYELGYDDGFIKNISRSDIEKYLYVLKNRYIKVSINYFTQFIICPRMFLQYIQLAEYDEAPMKDISLLFFNDDIPKKESSVDRMRRVKFIPTPILEQLDNAIMELDVPEALPIYILLRETGWRGTDILNLRYNNCLEKIWNDNEQRYNSYLCGEITKTGIALLKIPIRETVAEMVQKCIDTAKQSSTSDNNPKQYLFNTYDGKKKGQAFSKYILLGTIKRLIKSKNILDENGNLYHFRMHSLRHTRAKEFVEQGISISIVQQILGHRSLQMTVHYATVSENTLYEKWKSTEELKLFKLNIEDNSLSPINLENRDSDNLIRYEYVRKNLDAVKVPFGICFKSEKIPCRQQMNHCLTCASFCTTIENLPEYLEEINRVKHQINISDQFGRTIWKEKNEQYLKLLEDMVIKIKEQKIIHKNGALREENKSE